MSKGLVLVILFVGVFSLANAITFYTPEPEQWSGQEIWTVMWREVEGWADMSAFGKNYSVLVAPDLVLCADRGPDDPTNKIIFGFYGGCTGNEPRLRNWIDTGAVAIVNTLPLFFADSLASISLPEGVGGPLTPEERKFPFMSFRFLKDGYHPVTDPENPDMSLVVAGWASKYGNNMTAFMSQPQKNLLHFAYRNPANYFGFVTYFISTLALLGMIITAAKLWAFINYEGKIQASLPQIVLSLSWLSFFFMWFVYNYGPWYFYVLPENFADFFNYFFVPFAYCACVVMAFYYQEVSMLTSQSRTPGLDKMKWPAIIVSAVFFAGVFCINIIHGVDPPGIELVDLFVAETAIYISMCIVTSLLLGWGLFNLVRSMAGAKAVRKVAVLGIVNLVFLLGMGMAAWLYQLGSDPDGAIPIFKNKADIYSISTSYLLIGLHIAGTLYCLVFTFQVSVAKEIEISKSATSSTASSSSSSSSTSSSSTVNDPVIEL